MKDKLCNRSKKFLSILIVMCIGMLCMTNSSYARAGGGGSSGGSSGGGSASSASSTHYYGNDSRDSFTPLGSLLNCIVIVVFICGATIALKVKVLICAIQNKKKLKKLAKTDDIWKYKKIQKQVNVAFHKIQNGWTSNDLSICKTYMSEKLYNEFNIKLQWMTFKEQRNVLKAISLMKAEPVVVIDEKDNSKDAVWYYIEGAMIDYFINTQTKELISGSKMIPSGFVEYWKFVRDENDNWIVDEILQKNEFKY